MFYEDLSPCLYYSDYCPSVEKLMAVGWLGAGHAYTRRRVLTPRIRTGRLIRLLDDPWELCYFMGYDECGFCREQGIVPKQIHQMKFGGNFCDVGARNLFVPDENCVYVAPSLILHYIDEHDYGPPEVFWRAVMRCPEMGSETYRRAIARHVSVGRR